MDRIINSITEKITQNLQANIPRTPQKIQANIPKTPLITRKYSITPIQANIPKTPLITRKHSIASPIQKSHESLDQKDEESDYQLLLELFGLNENEVDEYLQQQAELKSQKQSHTDKVASRIAQRIEEKKLDKEIASSIPELFGNLDINDNSDAMDTSNLVHEIATDDNEYTLQLVRKKKVMAGKTKELAMPAPLKNKGGVKNIGKLFVN